MGALAVPENNGDGTTVIPNHECFSLFQYNHEYTSSPIDFINMLSLSFDPPLNIKILPQNILRWFAISQNQQRTLILNFPIHPGEYPRFSVLIRVASQNTLFLCVLPVSNSVFQQQTSSLSVSQQSWQKHSGFVSCVSLLLGCMQPSKLMSFHLIYLVICKYFLVEYFILDYLRLIVNQDIYYNSSATSCMSQCNPNKHLAYG